MGPINHTWCFESPHTIHDALRETFTCMMLYGAHKPYNMICEAHIQYMMIYGAHIPYNMICGAHIPYNMICGAHIPYDMICGAPQTTHDVLWAAYTIHDSLRGLQTIHDGLWGPNTIHDGLWGLQTIHYGLGMDRIRATWRAPNDGIFCELHLHEMNLITLVCTDGDVAPVFRILWVKVVRRLMWDFWGKMKCLLEYRFWWWTFSKYSKGWIWTLNTEMTTWLGK